MLDVLYPLLGALIALALVLVVVHKLLIYFRLENQDTIATAGIASFIGMICGTVACFIFMAFFSAPAYAWWDVGHKAVAKIAYDRLTPAAKEKVDQLRVALATQYPEVADFTDMAPWPDTLRQHKIETFTHWHYIDKPFSGDGTPVKSTVDTDNIAWAVEKIIPMMSNKEMNKLEQARFLAFLVHFVGDAHQPLHTVSRFAYNHPNGDQGGNLYVIEDPAHPTVHIPLHGYWDGGLGAFLPDAKIPLDKLVETITMTYPESYFGDKVHDLNPEDWVTEGNAIAEQFVYTAPENQVVTSNYQMAGRLIAEERVALAGYRLAYLLNTL